MNKIIIVLILALVGANTMTLMEKYPINFTPKRSIMTLLTQVESQLKTGGPLDAITNMLNEFQTTVTEEQVAHDQLWAEQQAECEQETEFRKTEIAAAQAALDEAQETLEGCSSQKVRAEGDLAVTKKQLIENRSNLARIIDIRRQLDYDFESAETAYTMISRALEEALEILEEIWTGDANFLQLTRHVNGIMKQTLKVKKTHLMTGVLSAMVQLANKDIQADEALLQEVKTLLTNFKRKMDSAFQELVAQVEGARQALDSERARLEQTIESLEAQKEGLEAEIDQLNKCIIVQSGIVQSATAKRNRNQRLLEDAENLCAAVAEEYEVATNARTEELELLRLIEERVEARFSELSDGVVARGMQDEFTYESDYDYDHQQFVPSN